MLDCTLTPLMVGGSQKSPTPKQVRKAGLAEKGEVEEDIEVGKQQGRWPEETGALCSAKKGLLVRHLPLSEAVEERRILNQALRDIPSHRGRK